MALKQMVTRPRMDDRPGQGLLHGEHIQVAYVTNDIERACSVFRERYGVETFGPLDADLPSGGKIHIELAWVGGTMLEIIEASGPGTEFYTSRLPTDEFAIRHHHLAYLVPDQAAWDELQNTIKTGGWEIVFEGHTDGFMSVCYVDAKELGHYLEYFLLGPAGVAFFESVPAT